MQPAAMEHAASGCLALAPLADTERAPLHFVPIILVDVMLTRSAIDGSIALGERYRTIHERRDTNGRCDGNRYISAHLTL